MLEYRLNNTDMLLVAQVGAMRNIRGLSKNYPDKAGFQNIAGHGWAVHIEGAAGEFVVAKYLGLYWGVEINGFRDGDMLGVDVKTTAYNTGRLLLKPDAPKDLAYVLVVGQVPTLRIAGWAYGHEVLQEQYLGEVAPGRPPAYAMPQRYLRPMPDLRRIILMKMLEREEHESNDQAKAA